MLARKHCSDVISLRKCFLLILLGALALVFVELSGMRYVWDGYAALQATFLMEDVHSSPVIGEQHLRFIQNLRLPSHDKWIVLDVMGKACASSLAVPQGWRMVLTGEMRNTGRCAPPDCLSLPPHMPLTGTKGDNALQRRLLLKNLAYLTAIRGGADVILEADCMTSLPAAVSTLAFSAGREHGVMYNETLLFNPYAHFGAWAGQPRAVVSENLTDNSRLYYVRDFDRVLIKHGLSDSSEDMVYASGNTTDSSHVGGMRFDPSTPPVFVGQGSYSLAISSCGIYRKEALWALLTPCVSSGPRCQLLRHFFQHRLLRELDAFVGLYQVDGRSFEESKKTKSKPFGASDSAVVEETGSSINARVLVEALNAWKCNDTQSFFRCFKDIATHLFKQEHIDSFEHSLITSWISALRNLEAIEPTMVNTPWRGVRKTSEVRAVLGNFQARLESGGAAWQKYLQQRLVKPLEDHCNKTGLFQFNSWRHPAITDVVLVVVFNSYSYFWPNLPIIESMHRPFFGHIFYCLPKLQQLLDTQDPHQRAVAKGLSFVEGFSDGWYLFYECVATVAQINLPGVRGYLHIGDDTLLNTWHMLNVSRDLLLSPPGGRIRSAEEMDFKGWVWWSSGNGRMPWLKTMSDLEAMSGLSDKEILNLTPNQTKISRISVNQRKMLASFLHRNGTFLRNATTFTTTLRKTKQHRSPYRTFLAGAEDWPNPTREEAERFIRNYYQSNGMAGLVRATAFDFFYIPQTLADHFVTISRRFMRYGVMDELALPTILYGIAQREEIRYVPSRELWGGPRHSPFSHYNHTAFFLHPLKMKNLWKSGSTVKLFCEKHIQKLFSELTKYANHRKGA